jgi:hypothetical protein
VSPRGVDPLDMDRRRHRLHYSLLLYAVWCCCAGFSWLGAVVAALYGGWGVAAGLLAVMLGFSAHARLERLDGHVHRGYVEVP